MVITPTVCHLAAVLDRDMDLEPLPGCCTRDMRSPRWKFSLAKATRHVATAKHQATRHGVDAAGYRAAKAHPLADVLRARLIGPCWYSEPTPLDVWLGEDRWARLAGQSLSALLPLVELTTAGLSLDQAERALDLLAPDRPGVWSGARG